MVMMSQDRFMHTKPNIKVAHLTKTLQILEVNFRQKKVNFTLESLIQSLQKSRVPIFST